MVSIPRMTNLTNFHSKNAGEHKRKLLLNYHVATNPNFRYEDNPILKQSKKYKKGQNYQEEKL